MENCGQQWLPYGCQLCKYCRPLAEPGGRTKGSIDRTHRIGQTNNIFAYRMICKDTIEDKILQLQEKKRALAKDIISDDTSFVKTLTREDVEYLFS